MDDKMYIFDPSKGDGIAGLPHEIGKKQAKEMGLLEVLEAAIASGIYKAKGGDKPAPIKEQANG